MELRKHGESWQWFKIYAFLLVFALVELKNECLRQIIFSIEKFYTTCKFVL